VSSSIYSGRSGFGPVSSGLFLGISGASKYMGFMSVVSDGMEMF
jgi:hypothetical protein